MGGEGGGRVLDQMAQSYESLSPVGFERGQRQSVFGRQRCSGDGGGGGRGVLFNLENLSSGALYKVFSISGSSARPMVGQGRDSADNEGKETED